MYEYAKSNHREVLHVVRAATGRPALRGQWPLPSPDQAESEHSKNYARAAESPILSVCTIWTPDSEPQPFQRLSRHIAKEPSWHDALCLMCLDWLSMNGYQLPAVAEEYHRRWARARGLV